MTPCPGALYPPTPGPYLGDAHRQHRALLSSRRVPHEAVPPHGAPRLPHARASQAANRRRQRVAPGPDGQSELSAVVTSRGAPRGPPGTSRCLTPCPRRVSASRRAALPNMAAAPLPRFVQSAPGGGHGAAEGGRAERQWERGGGGAAAAAAARG